MNSVTAEHFTHLHVSDVGIFEARASPHTSRHISLERSFGLQCPFEFNHIFRTGGDGLIRSSRGFILSSGMHTSKIIRGRVNIENLSLTHAHIRAQSSSGEVLIQFHKVHSNFDRIILTITRPFVLIHLSTLTIR